MQHVRVKDPRVHIVDEEEKAQVIRQGGLRVTPHQEPAQSASPQLIQFNFQPPSTSTIVSRDFWIRATFVITFDQDINARLGLSDALAAWPLNRIIDTVQLSINGNQDSMQSGDIAPALLTYHNNPEMRARVWSGTTAQPDQFQSYNDWVVAGSARNVMARYGENSAEMSRGGFQYTLLNNRQVQVTVTEPLLISPLTQTPGTDEGFLHVNQFQLQLLLKANQGLIWSSNAANVVTPPPTVVTWGGTGAGGAVTTADWTLLCTYITPDALVRLPPRVTYGHNSVNQFIKTVPTLAAQATTTVISDSVKLGMIPSSALLFARRSRATTTFNTPDAFAYITSVRLTWDNQELMASASPHQLWETSVSNGCNLSWPQWVQYRGSVLKLAFGKDIGLADDLAPGTQGQFNAQWQVTIQNPTGYPGYAAAAIDYEFYVVYIMEGQYSIVDFAARSTIGNLTRNEVLRAVSDAPLISNAQLIAMEGGSFWSDLKNVIRRVAGAVAKAAPIIAAVNPELGAAVGPIANAVHKLAGGRMVGGKLYLRHAR